MENTKVPVISAKDLNLWYGDFKALKNISLDVGEREITALILSLIHIWLCTKTKKCSRKNTQIRTFDAI